MSSSWRGRLSALREVPVPTTRPATASEISTIEPVRRYPSARAATAAFLTACLALVVVVANGVATRPAGESLQLGNLGNGWAPPAQLRPVSLSSAQAAVPFELARPESAIASDSLLVAAYVDPDAQGVRLDYQSGVVVLITPWPKGKDPAASYERQWKESGELGKLMTIDGRPAWAVPGDAKPTEVAGSAGSGVSDTSMNTVEFSNAGLDVVIAGPQPLSDLVQTASSVEVGGGA
jgi:hypothetical protein